MLQPENGVQDERAEEGEEHEARCIFRECHFYCGISPGDAVYQPLNRQAKAIKRRTFPRKNALQVSA